MWWKNNAQHEITFGACSDTGRVRSENQDAFGRFVRNGATETEDRLFIVADGMGGHARGGEASRTAIEVVEQTYFGQPDRPVTDRLRRALEAANLAIYQRAHSNGQVERMGTTCTSLVLHEGEVYLAHAGDSRAYRITRKRIEQLTLDHTVAEELRNGGLLTPEQARTHPQRNVLTRALGMNPSLNPDVRLVGPVHAGDAFLLCSDGLAGVPQAELHQTVLRQPPEQACERLVQAANARGGYDNVTVVVIRVS